MAVRIRMKKLGRRHRPFYRICAMDSHSPRNGRVIEELGTYDPMIPETDARAVLVNDRIKYWLSVGAQPSETVEYILQELGTLDRFARLKAGESMETLVAEAEAAEAAREPISPKTKYPAKPKPAAKKAEAPKKAEPKANGNGQGHIPKKEPAEQGLALKGE